MFYKAKNSTNYVEVIAEPEQGIHKTIKADEDDDSSQESPNKSSESSKHESKNKSVNASEDTPEDNLDDNQPDEPQVPQGQEQDLEEPSKNQDVLSKTLVQACLRPSPRQNKDIISIWKKWDVLL
jgi:hypothetical protein